MYKTNERRQEDTKTLTSQQVTLFLHDSLLCKIDMRLANSHGETGRVRRSVKPWLYLFATEDPHSIVVRGTYS